MENKDIPGYPNYFASSNGDIYAKSYNRTGKLQKIIPFITNKGYYLVDLYYKGKHKKMTVHRIIAKLFIPNPEQLPQINHINGDKRNNHYLNLEWCTNQYNHRWEFINGKKMPLGEKSYHHKLSESEVIEIRKLCSVKGHNKSEIARSYNVSQANISDIFHRKIWKHI